MLNPLSSKHNTVPKMIIFPLPCQTIKKETKMLIKFQKSSPPLPRGYTDLVVPTLQFPPCSENHESLNFYQICSASMTEGVHFTPMLML